MSRFHSIAVAAVLVAPMLAFLPNTAQAADLPDIRPQVLDHGQNGEQPLGRVRFTVSSGYFHGSVRHPLLDNRTAYGAMFEVDLGFLEKNNWSLGMFMHAAAMPLNRATDGSERYVRKGEDFSTPAVQTRAGCQDCVAPASGKLRIREMLAFSIGPRVEYAPIGHSGPFAAFGGGIGAINMEGSRLGAALDARAGYRYALDPRLSLGVHIGFHSIMANSAQAMVPFAAAEIRMN